MSLSEAGSLEFEAVSGVDDAVQDGIAVVGSPTSS